MEQRDGLGGRRHKVCLQMCPRPGNVLTQGIEVISLPIETCLSDSYAPLVFNPLGDVLSCVLARFC